MVFKSEVNCDVNFTDITLNIKKAMNRNSRSFINFQRAEGWCDSVIVDFELT
mgnify:CR=1 FL=1